TILLSEPGTTAVGQSAYALLQSFRVAVEVEAWNEDSVGSLGLRKGTLGGQRNASHGTHRLAPRRQQLPAKRRRCCLGAPRGMAVSDPKHFHHRKNGRRLA